MARVDDLLAQARSRYARVDAAMAAEESAAEGRTLLIDVRPKELREANGDISGAIPIGLNVLEWRLDPTSEWCLDQVRDDHTARIILFCQEGYSSSLAAARLLDLGLNNATDIVDGHDGWRAAGLPVVTFDPHADPETPVR